MERIKKSLPNSMRVTRHLVSAVGTLWRGVPWPTVLSTAQTWVLSALPHGPAFQT